MFDLLHQRWFSHCGRQKPISQFFPFHFLFYVRKCFSHCSKGSSLLFLPLVCYWHSWQFLPQDLCYNAKICCSLHRASWPGWAATYQVECKSLKVMSSHPVSGIAHKSMYLCIVIYAYKSVHLYSVAFFDRLSCLKKLVGEFSGNLEQPLPPHPKNLAFVRDSSQNDLQNSEDSNHLKKIWLDSRRNVRNCQQQLASCSLTNQKNMKNLPFVCFWLEKGSFPMPTMAGKTGSKSETVIWGRKCSRLGISGWIFVCFIFRKIICVAICASLI